jgi:sugar transferase (PEP-CTERM/EpsH1 system associated)
MKVLHIIPYIPVPPIFGGALRVYHILRHLVQHHEVTVLACGSSEDRQRLEAVFNSQLRGTYMVPRPWERRFRRLGQLYSLWTARSYFSVYANNRIMQRTLDEVLGGRSFDIIQIEFPVMAMFRFDTDAVRILDAHNVEYEIFCRMWKNVKSPLRRFHYHREYQKFFNEEIAVCRKQDAIFVTSERDRQTLDADVPDVPKFVVPNGVDATYFTPSPDPSEPWSLVFSGLMSYVPNYDGMLYFLDEIFPRVLKDIPQAKLYIVGNKPPKVLQKRASRNIVVTGFVDDVRPFIRQSSVYVVPLRMGSGTRLKVLEAMAMKKPIVTTSIGCEGIDVRHEESALIADNPQEFAESVVRLLRKAELRRRLAENAYELMHTHYEWPVVTERIEEYYDLIIRRTRRKRNSTQWVRRDANETIMIR